jgi:hypothetical protein
MKVMKQIAIAEKLSNALHGVLAQMHHRTQDA